jgi:hypothetical protein
VSDIEIMIMTGLGKSSAHRKFGREGDGWSRGGLVEHSLVVRSKRDMVEVVRRTGKVVFVWR